MKRSIVWFIIAGWLVSTWGGFIAAESPVKSSGGAAARELSQIRSSVQDFVAAFNKHDAQGVARCWTVDGEFVEDSGRKYVGREAIEKGYASFFEKNPEARIRIVVDSLRLLSDAAAIEDGRSLVEPAPPGAPGVSKYSAIHVKLNDQWLMASVRDSWMESASGFDHVADLEWLIGTWKAEEHGATSESDCRWIANKSFVERHYTVTQPDGTVSSGIQIIGWNALGGQIQSWNFSSDGGHAVGIWTPVENGWSIELRGATGAGASTSAVNLLIKLDNDTYSWQSVKRSVADRDLPDTDEIILKRQSKNG